MGVDRFRVLCFVLCSTMACANEAKLFPVIHRINNFSLRSDSVVVDVGVYQRQTQFVFVHVTYAPTVARKDLPSKSEEFQLSLMSKT